MGALLTAALLVVTAVGCATIASLNAAGEALQDAGYEIHDLLMEEDGVVSADLERPDGATDEEHFHEAAAILWEHLHDDAQQAEIRIRSDDDVDRIETYSAVELNELHNEMRP
jgi:hypothetical protein